MICHDTVSSGNGPTTKTLPLPIDSEISNQFQDKDESLLECLKSPPSNSEERSLSPGNIAERTSPSHASTPYIVDEKYDEGGKYGFKKSPGALGVRPNTQSAAKQLALPRLHSAGMSDAGEKVDSSEESSPFYGKPRKLSITASFR